MQSKYLKQAVTHQTNQQLLLVLLHDVGRVPGGEHRGEVKQSHVRFPVVIESEFKMRQLQK